MKDVKATKEARERHITSTERPEAKAREGKRAEGLEMKNGTTAKIKRAFDLEDWLEARKLLEHELQSHPKEHWLWTRLAITYYEEHEYRKALEFNEKALDIAPSCPLARWDHACILDMLNEKEAALSGWRRLLRSGPAAAALEPCGEGLKWAMSLLNDCRYRIALASADICDFPTSVRYMRAYVMRCRKGISSIYDVDEASEKLDTFQASAR